MKSFKVVGLRFLTTVPEWEQISINPESLLGVKMKENRYSPTPKDLPDADRVEFKPGLAKISPRGLCPRSPILAKRNFKKEERSVKTQTFGYFF